MPAPRLRANRHEYRLSARVQRRLGQPGASHARPRLEPAQPALAHVSDEQLGRSAVAAAAAGHHSRATFKSGGSSAASSLATSRSEHFQNPRRPALPSKARVSQGGGAPSLLKSGVISAASGSGGALSAPTEQVVAELVSQLAASLSLRAKDRENSQRERERERAHFDSAASQLLDRLEEAQAQLALAGRSMSG
mmetsp:Transcript_37808/g.93594  ORF Transcript_37808/g.93594 Transcript_37808/m.93594 type:complete len:194 (+) Transcript_37808:443-1024(+)